MLSGIDNQRAPERLETEASSKSEIKYSTIIFIFQQGSLVEGLDDEIRNVWGTENN